MVKKTQIEKGKNLMKKQYALCAIFAALVLGVAAGCLSHCGKTKVAVVDITAVVNKSENVQRLKTEQAAKAQEMSQWLQEAQKNVEQEKNKEKKDALLKQYNAEFTAKTEKNKQEYALKLQELDRNITQTIKDEAKKKGYKMVVAKNLVIYGGDDITEDVIKVVK